MIYVYRYLMIVLYTVFWGLIACFLGFVDRSGEGVIWVARNWVSWILATCRVEIVYEGLDRIDPKQPYQKVSITYPAIVRLVEE